MALTQADLDRILGTRPTAQGIFNANQPTIKNTPRSTVSGTWADILKPIVSNPVGELVGAADMQRALDSASYNQPLTTGGSVQTGGFRPEYLAAALGLTPMGKGAKVAKKTTFETAQETARRNATLPVSEGGLGLPATNTAMDRAKAMGFDTSTTKYHGTNSDINAFDYSKTGKGQDQWGSGFYFTDRPSTANAYVNPLNVAEGGNVYPVYTKIENPLKYDPTSIALQKDISQSPLTKKEIKDLITKSPNLDDALWNWGDWASEGKNKVINDAVNAYYNPKSFSLQTLNSINNDFYSGIPKAFNENAKKAMGKDALKVGFESGETFDVMWNPSNIRSVNAAFDPFRRNEPDILAGVAAAPVGLLAVDKEKTKKK